jgi:hypothetical protein
MIVAVPRRLCILIPIGETLAIAESSERTLSNRQYLRPIGNISAGATSGSCPIDNIFAGVAFQSARRTLPPIRQVGLWQSLEMTGKRVLVRSEMLAVCA